jgi:hypothetical protein
MTLTFGFCHLITLFFFAGFGAAAAPCFFSGASIPVQKPLSGRESVLL